MQFKEPDFMIVGAQKAGTTWLWDKLKRHPGTSLPQKKEIHYFGGVENYAKGEQWYLDHFRDVDPEKVSGEASTTYFYDYMPYWQNPSHELQFDGSQPPIPELITRRFPEIKIIVSLRDPVSRAVSAYRHWMTKGNISPSAGLQATATKYPKLRIIEYGYYSDYLEMWMRYVPADRLFLIIFEEDIIGHPQKTLEKLFKFLNLASTVNLEAVNEIVHRSWNWNRIILNYYLSSLTRILGGRISNYLAGALTIFNLRPFTENDLKFLRSIYLPEKNRLEQLTGRSLSCWHYGKT